MKNPALSKLRDEIAHGGCVMKPNELRDKIARKTADELCSGHGILLLQLSMSCAEQRAAKLIAALIARALDEYAEELQAEEGRGKK